MRIPHEKCGPISLGDIVRFATENSFHFLRKSGTDSFAICGADLFGNCGTVFLGNVQQLSLRNVEHISSGNVQPMKGDLMSSGNVVRLPQQI